METVRVRLVFEDRHMLSKSQKSEGLKRTWLVLKPEHGTISDLSSHLIHIFELDHSCPNGLLLSMDGFVLPPFESTCILKDKDIIRVKKKGGTSSDIIRVGDEAKPIEEEEIVEKQPVLTGVPLLTNGEFEKETGGYQSEPEEDEDYQSEDTLHVENLSGGNATSKKRKASQKIQSSKRKKKCPMVPEAVENGVHTEEIENNDDRALPGKCLHKKEKVSHIKSKPDTSKPESAERSNNIIDSMPTANSSGQLQENGIGSVDVSDMPDGTKKAPSRSARRKKAKRQWLRQLSTAEKKELNWRQAAKKVVHKKSTGRKGLMTLFPNQNSDAEDEIVPIVIRPGHIRFEPLAKALQQNQEPLEAFQWNGITSKKKGQKWGKEKGSNSSSVRRNDYQDFSKEFSETPTIEKEAVLNDPIDFDKLKPFASLPKEGDVIAYRLLELSSSWTPELSSFRVGKTSLYDPKSNSVVLRPVPEYSSAFEKKVDGDTSAQQPEDSLCREDGSLEIDFSSLVDVRIVKCGNSDSAKANGGINGGHVGNKDAVSGVVPNNNDKHTHAPVPEKEVNVWDEFSQALSAKQEQLSWERGWSKNSGRSSWSNRPLRSRALGPQTFKKQCTWSNRGFSKNTK
uniref:Putative coilin isoform X3 n=1 Tax=Davidia involucrata TaxID=16924 RepID=A0A5B6YIN3_DAVIN